MADLLNVARGVNPFAIGSLLFLCVCLTGLGGYQLFRLDNTHQRNEVLYSVSPVTLKAWLATLDQADFQNARRLADRLIGMTLPQRRDTVLAVARTDYFETMGIDFAAQRRLQMMMLEALRQALAMAPALGDLWFLAASLHRRLFGFDETVQRYLELSFTYSPKEVDVVLERLRMTSLAWPLLNDRLKEIVGRDIHIVDQVYPDRAGELRQFFQRAGANLDDPG